MLGVTEVYNQQCLQIWRELVVQGLLQSTIQLTQFCLNMQPSPPNPTQLRRKTSRATISLVSSVPSFLFLFFLLLPISIANNCKSQSRHVHLFGTCWQASSTGLRHSRNADMWGLPRSTQVFFGFHFLPESINFSNYSKQLTVRQIRGKMGCLGWR